MRIKGFNELIKDMGIRESSPCDEIDKLADKLLAQGITTSKFEAKEKARDMLSTNKSMQDEHAQKSQKNTTFNDPRNNPDYGKYRNDMIQEMRKRAMEGPKKIHIQSEFQTPGFEQKNGSLGLPRAGIQDTMRKAPVVSSIGSAQHVSTQQAPKASTTANQEPVKQETAPVVTNATQQPAQTPTIPKIEVYSTSSHVDSSSTARDEQQRNNTTQKVDEKPARKQNPAVDLTSVFNFSK